MRKDLFLIVNFEGKLFKVYLDGEITPIEGRIEKHIENCWSKDRWNKRRKEIITKGKILGLYKDIKIGKEYSPGARIFFHTGCYHPLWRSEKIEDEVLERHFIGIVKRFINKQFPIDIPRPLV